MACGVLSPEAGRERVSSSGARAVGGRAGVGTENAQGWLLRPCLDCERDRGDCGHRAP